MTGAPAGDEQFARNLVGGRWEFPAVPFEYEIRSPLDGSVVATVPLSSRLDVARAITAAGSAAQAWAADPGARQELLARLAAELAAQAGQLADLQAAETGLDQADSTAATRAVADLAARLTERREDSPASGVTGHILSWGLPLAEVICSVLPRLAAGQTAVIKPSLRAPLSAVAFAHLATQAGLPPGVVNLVQGTGVDVGAALLGSPGLASLHVRAGERTLAQAARGAASGGVRLAALRAGGNVLVAGREADAGLVAAVLAGTLRSHNCGGLLALPLLCVHAKLAESVIDAIAERLPGCLPAPLPTEALRQRALCRIERLRGYGARLVYGGAVPDDSRHRMGWIVPPALLDLGLSSSSVSLAALASEPLGPVLTVLRWRGPEELQGIFAHPRYGHGLACAWGISRPDLDAAGLPHPAILQERTPLSALATGTLPAA